MVVQPVYMSPEDGEGDESVICKIAYWLDSDGLLVDVLDGIEDVSIAVDILLEGSSDPDDLVIRMRCLMQLGEEPVEGTCYWQYALFIHILLLWGVEKETCWNFFQQASEQALVIFS